MATSKSIGFDNIQTETVIHTMFMEKKRSVRAESLFTDVRMCIIIMMLLYLHRYTGLWCPKCRLPIELYSTFLTPEEQTPLYNGQK